SRFSFFIRFSKQMSYTHMSMLEDELISICLIKYRDFCIRYFIAGIRIQQNLISHRLNQYFLSRFINFLFDKFMTIKFKSVSFIKKNLIFDPFISKLLNCF